MPVADKLQIKPDHRVAVLRAPADVDLELDAGQVGADPESADAVILFAAGTTDLTSPDGDAVVAAASRDALAWVAYPKAGQLGTDLNRDSLAAALSGRAVRAVRQVSIDPVWSALRFRPAG